MAAGEFIEVLSSTTLTDLDALNARLISTIESVSKINTMMGTAFTPSANALAIDALNAKYIEQEQIIKKLQTSLDNLTAAKARNNIKTSEEIVNQRILAQSADNVAKSNSALVGSYQKLSLAYAKAKTDALNLGATYGLQSKQFIDAAAKVRLMSDELKGLDAQVGVNTRNVGNYGNTFTNALSTIYSKVRVLAYILPGVGIGTIFGLALNPLLDYLKGLDSVKKMMGIVSEQVKITSSAFSDMGKEALKNAASEQVNAKILLATAADVNLSYKERLIAVDEIQKQYPFYFENLTKEQILAGDTADAERQLNAAILERAKAQAATAKITEISGKIIDTEFAIIKAERDVTKATNEQAESFKKLVAARNSTRDIEIFAAKDAANAVTQSKEKVTNLQKEKAAYEATNAALLKYATAAGKGAIGLDYKAPKDTSGKDEKDRLKAIEDALKSQFNLKQSNLEREIKLNKERLDNDTLYLKERQDLIEKNAVLETQLAANEYVEQIRLHKDSKDKMLIDANNFRNKTDDIENKKTDDLLKELDKQYKAYEDYHKKFKDEGLQLNIFGDDPEKTFEDWQKGRDKGKKVTDQVKADLTEFNRFVGDFANKAGFAQTFDFISKVNPKTGKTMFESLKEGEDSYKAYFLAITSAAQDAANLIEKNQEMAFANEKQRLSDEKNIAITFAGDSAAAKTKIEFDYQKKVREVNRQEAIQKKEMAMFNIAIDTAQAVMAVSGKGEEWMVPTMIALGALEEALVASQKLPALWTGTDNAKEGFAWTDERGAELHTDSHGRIKDFGSDKGTRKKYLQSGDKIYNAFETKKILQQNDFDTQLGNILSSSGTNVPLIINNGITASEMDKMLEKHIASQSTIVNRWDKNGFNSYINKNGNITRRAEMRGSGKGISV